MYINTYPLRITHENLTYLQEIKTPVIVTYCGNYRALESTDKNAFVKVYNSVGVYGFNYAVYRVYGSNMDLIAVVIDSYRGKYANATENGGYIRVPDRWRNLAASDDESDRAKFAICQAVYNGERLSDAQFDELTAKAYSK